MFKIIKKLSLQLWLVLITLFIVLIVVFIFNKNSSFKSFAPQSGIFQDSQQIDLSIKETNSGKYRYKNENPLHKTSFRNDPTKSTAIHFANKYIELSFFTNPKQSFAKASDNYSPQIKDNQIIYSSIFPNTDLVYTVNPSQLLEEFIVHDKDTALNMTEISQTLDRRKIDSYKEINGTIELYKNKRIVATIPRPVIYEESDQSIRSYELSYELTPIDNNYLTIKKVINQKGLDWLSDSKRNYPIVIDLVIDNADTAASWTSSDTVHTVVSQETTIKQEGSGSVKITTSAESSPVMDNMEYSSDATAQSNYVKSSYTVATGGTITYSGGYTIHTFLSSSTFTPNSTIGDAQVLVVAGGGGGAADRGGAGGAGGLRYSSDFSISSGGKSVTVGAGGAGQEGNVRGSNGSNSVFSTLTATGGGGGGTGFSLCSGSSGGSGGGAGNTSSINPCAGGSGTGGQGYAGGQGVYTSPGYGPGGGGGASEVGQAGTSTYGGDGGDGLQYSISGSATYYAGGGGAGTYNDVDHGVGGLGGGGNGGHTLDSEPTDGAANTGGGGGGRARGGNIGGDGGSGIVIIRYITLPLQSYSSSSIKTQGSYSLKGIAQSGTSLNQTLTKTTSSLNLTDLDDIKFDIRASRTGSNIKIGIYDSGGTTSEITPNITSADSFQTVTWDISGISNANKDDIDKIIITIVNASAINTFYVDNMYAVTTGSLNDTVTLTASSTDLSSQDNITFWVRSDTTGQFARFQFGESASSEQTYDIGITSADTWEQKSFDITGIGSTGRDGVTKYAFKITDPTAAPLLYFDDIQTSLNNIPPNTPSLDSPTDTATNQSSLPSLLTTTTDTESDYLRYKIEICENLAMDSNCQTFDQTSSQVGWSGQDTQTSTAYTSGTQATYIVQSNLNTDTTYYWRSYAIDPDGSTAWSATQGTPYSFTTDDVPNTPSLDSPSDTATGQSVTPSLLTTATDGDSDYLRYKIEICENLDMDNNCQTFNQTSSQVGWSGQDSQTNTAYASGTQATYIAQNGLDTDTTYFWRSYAIDPAGSNAWSATQGTPYSFTTSFYTYPFPVTSCLIQESSDDSQLRIFWTDVATDEDGYVIQRSVNSGSWSILQNLGVGITAHIDSDISSGNTYQYKIAPYYTGPIYSTWCTTSLLDLNLGNFDLEGLNLEGINLN